MITRVYRCRISDQHGRTDDKTHIGRLDHDRQMVDIINVLRQFDKLIFLIASEKAVTAIEVEENKLKMTRRGDFIQLGGKFPRLTKKEAKARLKEIKRLLLAI